MKNRPSDGKLLLLAVAAALLAGTAAAARADDAADLRKTRKAAITGTETWVADLCKTAGDWKILSFDPAGGAGLKELKAAGLKPSASSTDIKAKDTDMPNWLSPARDGLRASVVQLRQQCVQLKDPKTGLRALASDGVALEKITEGAWRALIEKFDEARVVFDGKTSRPGESSNSHYFTRYPDGAGKKLDRPSSIKKLSEDTIGYFLSVLDGGLLDSALKQATGESAKKP